MSLSEAQKAAIECVTTFARARRDDAVAVQDHICRMCDIPADAMRETLLNIKRNARVALHFHPDRPSTGGETVALRLVRDGVYRSQFETRISNGGLSAHPGGRRDACERHLFGGAYHSSGIADAERPKYGSLDLLRHSEGASPRFGSCYFVLTPDVSQRCTFTHKDSHDDPIERGTYEELDDIFAVLLRDVFYHEIALGERDLTVPSLIERLQRDLQLPLGTPAIVSPVRNLNQFIEAQVHGDVLLGRDVDALVADPSFHGTETGGVLLELCERQQIELYWHHGFRLTPDAVPSDFRGPTMPSLAKRVAQSGWVDASAIGAAVRDLHVNPDAWGARGSFEDVLQELKLLWHVLVKYGAPFASKPTRAPVSP